MAKLNIIVLFLFSVTFFITCSKKGKNNEEACNGNTRRLVKVMIDDAIKDIDTIPILTTIDSIGKIAVPEVDKDTPRQAIELKTFTITAKVEKLKRERDGDYHIKLIDEDGNYIITEAPNPKCDYTEQSEYLSVFQEVRSFIEKNAAHLEGETITVTGVAFIDIDHHYKRNQAENNIELHPILKISY